MAKIKPSSAKAKGRTAQQQIAQYIVDNFPELKADDVVSRPMGSGGCDLICSPLAQKVFPISVESKATKGIPGKAELEQAAYNTYEDTIPVVVWKRPRVGKNTEDFTVMLTLKNLVELVKLVRAQQAKKD